MSQIKVYMLTLIRIEAITKMSTPQSKEDIHILQGTARYLARFIPHLLLSVGPLHELTDEGVKFSWGTTQQKSFNEIKHLVTTTSILSYYEPGEELVPQCDASQSGLGAALLQNGHPIAYNFPALTETETQYATIEKCLPLISPQVVSQKVLKGLEHSSCN